jgi:heterodisulfide reductase subunit A
VDVEQLTEFAQGLDGVAVARNYRYMCSDPGQALIKEDIKEDVEKLNLNPVIVAACSHQMH